MHILQLIIYIVIWNIHKFMIHKNYLNKLKSIQNKKNIIIINNSIKIYSRNNIKFIK